MSEQTLASEKVIKQPEGKPPVQPDEGKKAQLGERERKILDRLERQFEERSTEDLHKTIQEIANGETKPRESEDVIKTSRELEELDVGLIEDPQAIVDLLVRAENLSVSNLEANLARLRGTRDVGDSTYRINDPNTYLLDEVVILLAQGGHWDLVEALLSSSPKELDQLDWSMERMINDTDQITELKARIKDLHQKKQREFREKLSEKGADANVQKSILENASDPDSALEVSNEFWQLFPSLSYDVRFLITNSDGNIEIASRSLMILHEQRLIDFASKVIPSLRKLSSIEEQSSYLVSLKKAVEAVNSDEQLRNRYIRTNSVINHLLTFKDPLAALEGAKTLFGDEYGSNILWFQQLCGQSYGDSLTEFSPDFLKGLIDLKVYFDGDEVGIKKLTSIAKYLQKSEDPLAYSQTLIEALTIAQSIVGEKTVLYDIAQSKDPIALARAYMAIEPLVSGKDEAIVRELHSRINMSENPHTESSTFIQAESELQKHELSLEVVGIEGFLDFASILTKGGEQVKIDKELVRFCSDWKVKQQYKTLYEKYMKDVIETGNPRSIRIEQKPKLEDLPEILSRFQEIGIERELAEAIFESWSSYRALDRLLFKDEKLGSNATESQVRSAVDDQTKIIMEQIDTLSSYAETYGSKEMLSVIKTFGIYNFIRYKPEQLHTQLISWQNGEIPTRNILISARSDWNGSIDSSGKDYVGLFGEEGFFAFEANNPTELAKIAVEIGNREKLSNREPDVRNFLIVAHANQNGLLFGVNSESLEVSDYVDADRSRARIDGKINDYKKHLGRNFRLILQACKTAGEGFNGTNIAKAISKGHNVHVEASSQITIGRIIINPDNSVTFQTQTDEGEVQTVPSTTYIPDQS